MSDAVVADPETSPAIKAHDREALAVADASRASPPQGSKHTTLWVLGGMLAAFALVAGLSYRINTASPRPSDPAMAAIEDRLVWRLAADEAPTHAGLASSESHAVAATASGADDLPLNGPPETAQAALAVEGGAGKVLPAP